MQDSTRKSLYMNSLYTWIQEQHRWLSDKDLTGNGQGRSKPHARPSLRGRDTPGKMLRIERN